MARCQLSATRTPPKAREDCNPPQSAMRPSEHAELLQAVGASIVRAQNRLQKLIPEAPDGCALRMFSCRFQICPTKAG
eukprot:1318779-Alexandrium_andersonii.AAC.1